MGAGQLMFDAQAEAKAAEGKYLPFTFRGLDGTEYSLPHPVTLTERQGGLIAAGEVKAVIREIDEKAFDAVEAMPIHISGKFATAWLELLEEQGKADSPSSEITDGGEL